LNRFRQAFPNLRGTDRAERAGLAEPFPFQKSSERAQSRQRAHQRPAADIIGAARGHEGADIARLKRGEALQCRQLAPVLAEKRQALPDVTRIGLAGLGREPSLGPQMCKPSHDLPSHIRGRACESREQFWSGLGHDSYL
jgi:hypothetical protein